METHPCPSSSQRDNFVHAAWLIVSNAYMHYIQDVLNTSVPWGGTPPPKFIMWCVIMDDIWVSNYVITVAGYLMGISS